MIDADLEYRARHSAADEKAALENLCGKSGDCQRQACLSAI